MKPQLAVFARLVLVVFGLQACKGSSPGTDAGPAGGNAGTDAPVAGAGGSGSVPRLDAAPFDVAPLPAGSARIGANGGSVVSEDGRVTVQIPPEALPAFVTISVAPIPDGPGGLQGPLYKIGPTGTRLAHAAVVIWKPTDADLAGTDIKAERLGRYTSGGQWVELDNEVASASEGTVKATTTLLSLVGLIPGVCGVCPTGCNASNCFINDLPGMPGSGIPGQCRAYGRGCSRCVPVCDGDGDGYCSGSPSDGSPGGDCDDQNPAVHPEGKEICGNTIDEDCNGHQDEGCRPCKTSNDCPVGNEACVKGVCEICSNGCDPAMCTFGTPPVPGRCVPFGRGCTQCVPSCDADGDGYCPGTRTDNQPDGDCDDQNPAVSPDAVELCGDKIDNDCDGKVDEVCGACKLDVDCPAQQRCQAGFCAPCPPTCTAAACMFGTPPLPGRCAAAGNGCSVCVPACDIDGDGYCPGDPGNDQPGRDCNDNDPQIHPDAVEICGNNADDNCDDHRDEGCQPCNTDADCSTGMEGCVGGFCAVCNTCSPADCKFGDQPGRCVMYGLGCSRCVPSCDKDGDGYCPGDNPPNDVPGKDCDDGNAAVNPGVHEICGNGVDDDCNGLVDDGCALCQTAAACGNSQSCSSGK